MNKTVMLLIMDGFGIAEAGPGNAIAKACTPNLDRLFSECPNSLLEASGRAVGLPDGQMGNSEVGHTNIGAGRVVWQELSKITNEIENGEFFGNKVLCGIMDKCLENGGALHLMGLLSDGGVHSHNTHLYALLKLAKQKGLEKVFVHCILDGRDVPPTSAGTYIKELEDEMKTIGVGKIGSICGRFYAMDRDKRWERVEEAYGLYTRGAGRKAESAAELLEAAYGAGETDEFVKPGIVENTGTVKNGDGIIFFNFRPDRAREITRCFVDPQFDGFERKTVLSDLSYVCFTQYDASIPGVEIAFPPQSLKNTLGEYVSSLGKTQLRIAETEKYAHVTFFFNGGVEEPYPGEDRILIPSPKVATYDLKPEMSAFEVTDAVVKRIEEGGTDLIIMNLANCDMVGHTGVFEAAVAAVEAVDSCVGRIAAAIEKTGGKLLITADHGNADVMLDGEGNVVTSHSTNPVPLIYFDPELPGKGETAGFEALRAQQLQNGALCDLAPTLLGLMGLEVPAEMEGKNLLA